MGRLLRLRKETKMADYIYKAKSKDLFIGLEIDDLENAKERFAEWLSMDIKTFEVFFDVELDKVSLTPEEEHQHYLDQKSDELYDRRMEEES
jgi:hypothetical protein